MRKALVIALALAVFFSGLLAYGGIQALEPIDKVVYEDECFFGDIRAAEGLSIQGKAFFQEQLSWDSRLDFTSDGVSCVATYDFSQLKKSGKNEIFRVNNVAVNMAYEIPEVSEAISEQMAYEKKGTRHLYLFDISKYVDYYPMEFYVHIETDKAYLQYGHSAKSSSEMEYLANYFKIPLTGKNYIIHDVEIDEYSHGSAADLLYSYECCSASVFDDEYIYLYITNKDKQGNNVDFSQVPGGYGIYRIPYGENRLYAEQIEMFHALPEASDVLHMELNSDETKLVYHSLENEDYYVTVVSLATGEVLERVSVGRMEWREEYERQQALEEKELSEQEELLFVDIEVLERLGRMARQEGMVEISPENVPEIQIDNRGKENADIIARDFGTLYYIAPTYYGCRERLIISDSGNTLIYIGNDTVSLISEDEEGIARLAFTAPQREMEVTGSDLKYELSNGYKDWKLCFDGERLAVARYADTDWYYKYYFQHSANIILAVYDSDGLAYYGKLNSSLDGEPKIAGKENNYRKNAKTYRNIPLQLSWQ